MGLLKRLLMLVVTRLLCITGERNSRISFAKMSIAWRNAFRGRMKKQSLSRCEMGKDIVSKTLACLGIEVIGKGDSRCLELFKIIGESGGG